MAERGGTVLVAVAAAVVVAAGVVWWAGSGPPAIAPPPAPAVSAQWAGAAMGALRAEAAAGSLGIAAGGPYELAEPGSHNDPVVLAAGGYDLAAVCVGGGDATVSVVDPRGRSMSTGSIACTVAPSLSYLPVYTGTSTQAVVRIEAGWQPATVAWRLVRPEPPDGSWLAQARRALPVRSPVIADGEVELGPGDPPARTVELGRLDGGVYRFEAVCSARGAAGVVIGQQDGGQNLRVECVGPPRVEQFVIPRRGSRLSLVIERRRGSFALVWHVTRVS